MRGKTRNKKNQCRKVTLTNPSPRLNAPAITLISHTCSDTSPPAGIDGDDREPWVFPTRCPGEHTIYDGRWDGPPNTSWDFWPIRSLVISMLTIFMPWDIGSMPPPYPLHYSKPTVKRHQADAKGMWIMVIVAWCTTFSKRPVALQFATVAWS